MQNSRHHNGNRVYAIPTIVTDANVYIVDRAPINGSLYYATKADLAILCASSLALVDVSSNAYSPVLIQVAIVVLKLSFCSTWNNQHSDTQHHQRNSAVKRSESFHRVSSLWMGLGGT